MWTLIDGIEKSEKKKNKNDCETDLIACAIDANERKWIEENNKESPAYAFLVERLLWLQQCQSHFVFRWEIESNLRATEQEKQAKLLSAYLVIFPLKRK